jgi:hypothetical protein
MQAPFTSENHLFCDYKKISEKAIDPGSDFDRFILHPETGEMVQFETSVARRGFNRGIKRALVSSTAR